jgi:hypothetical protein
MKMAGYSGTPLAKKLGIKSGSNAFFQNLPKNILAELMPALSDVKVSKSLQAGTDFIHAFATSKADLIKSFPTWKKNLSKTGCLWVSWPKKTSGLTTDLSGDAVREIGLNASLVDIKVCAVDDLWSGLKFVYRKANR